MIKRNCTGIYVWIHFEGSKYYKLDISLDEISLGSSGVSKYFNLYGLLDVISLGLEYGNILGSLVGASIGSSEVSKNCKLGSKLNGR